MSTNLTKSKIDEDLKLEIRANIAAIEESIKDNQDPNYKVFDFKKEGDKEVCPVTHTFTDGVYMREMFIPKGLVIVGKIHKHEHPSFLMQGKIQVLSETGGEQLLEAPQYVVSEGGTKRVAYILEDVIWITVHANPTNTQDLKEIEEIYTADNYEEYNKYIKLEGKPMSRLKKLLIKKLSV